MLADLFSQILFSPAYCPTTDKSTGEETELYHSCASKWTNTRNMGPSGEYVYTKSMQRKAWVKKGIHLGPHILRRTPRFV